MALPMPRPSCGRRLAPKMMITIIRMITSSVSPMRPMRLSPCGPIVPCILLACLVLADSHGIRAFQFASGVSAFDVYATVTDARGEPIAGLAAADFTVLEDGIRQAVNTFAAGE